MKENAEFIVRGRDAWGNAVEERITMPPPPKRWDRLKAFVVRWSPRRMRNFWYQLGWTRFRYITKITPTNGTGLYGKIE